MRMHGKTHCTANFDVSDEIINYGDGIGNRVVMDFIGYFDRSSRPHRLETMLNNVPLVLPLRDVLRCVVSSVFDFITALIH